MGRIEKTVFISYRRNNKPWALFIYQNLTMHGYDVFIDFQNINSGNFERAILDNIRTRAHFIVILTPSALERCKNPGDWLRREIETAMDEKRNIVPLMVEGFDFGSPLIKEALTGRLAALSDINALSIPDDYPLEAMDRLRARYLNIALSDVALPALQKDVQEVTNAEKSAANEAAPVSEEQLTAQTWFEKGYVFQEAKNLDEAFRCYSQALLLDPNLDVAHNNLGVLLCDLKRKDEAEAAYRKAIELNPALTEAYSNLGVLLRDLKRKDEAEAVYRKAIELNPADDKTYSNLGLLLNDLKRNDEAEAAYRKAIELNPARIEAYSNLGNLLRNLKRNDEAEAAYRKAIKLNPALTEAYSNLGNLLRDLKHNAEAEAAYRKAIELNPSFDIAYVNLGQLLLDQGKVKEAVNILTEAIQHNPESARCYRQRGLFYQTAGSDQSAMDDYRQAIALQPDYGIVRMSLFGLLMKIGNTEEASQHEALAREFAKNESEYNRACFESLCNNTEEAVNLLKIAFEKGESSKEWAKQDPDLENIRNDPRFKELVGE